MNVEELIQQAVKSPSRTAQLSGISRMTLKRLKDGSVTPNFTTLREIAIALGFDIQLKVVPASDGDAAVAARVLLDPEMENVAVRDQVQGWANRIKRHDFEHPRVVARYAGKMSSPQHREGALFFAPRPGIDSDRVPLILMSAAGIETYAISGGPAARAFTGTVHSAPVLMWVSERTNIHEVGERIAETFTRADSFQPGGVLLAHAPVETFLDPFEEAGVLYTSPLQTVIDLYGLNAETTAEMISKDW